MLLRIRLRCSTVDLELAQSRTCGTVPLRYDPSTIRALQREMCIAAAVVKKSQARCPKSQSAQCDGCSCSDLHHLLLVPARHFNVLCRCLVDWSAMLSLEINNASVAIVSDSNVASRRPWPDEGQNAQQILCVARCSCPDDLTPSQPCDVHLQPMFWYCLQYSSSDWCRDGAAHVAHRRWPVSGGFHCKFDLRVLHLAKAFL